MELASVVNVRTMMVLSSCFDDPEYDPHMDDPSFPGYDPHMDGNDPGIRSDDLTIWVDDPDEEADDSDVRLNDPNLRTDDLDIASEDPGM